MVRLGIPKEIRDWWTGIWEKLLLPVLICNAVGQTLVTTGEKSHRENGLPN